MALEPGLLTREETSRKGEEPVLEPGSFQPRACGRDLHFDYSSVVF